ncbi:MAG: type II secretion system protein [Lachnospiraceae bacterium]|nr:type II secretion system protein [Lachnospiraceae bacterium]
MRALREKMKEAAKKDNRGLSLVEILCAIAIFSMIAAAIGTVIVLSSRTFRRGVTETSLQQEAQLVANRIGTIVQDACEASFDEGAKTLTLKTNDNKEFKISLSGEELVYSDATMSGAKLAEKIQSFSVKTDDFEKSNTVYLDMRVADGTKVYNVQYAISARNQMTTDIPNTPLTEHVSIFSDSEVVMVPGETYTIPYSVAGKVTIGMDAAVTSGTATIGAIGMDGVEVTIPTDTTDSVVQLKVFTKDTLDGTTTPKATASINIRVRRVKTVSVTHNSDRSAVDPSKSGNSYEAQGCVYTFYARVSADNPEKQAGTTYDSGWKNPNAVYWTDKATLNGTTVNVTDYFNVVYSEDLNIPTAKYTIKEDLPNGLELTVRATSKHAKGANKASSDYYVDSKGVHWNEDSIKARPAKVEMLKTELSLDPTESVSVKLSMKGGKLDNIECIPIGNTDSNTKAYFNPDDGCVHISLGQNERGSGTTPNDPKQKFTFTVDVMDKSKGEKKATITIHVKRIDRISLDKVDNKDGSYTFTTRFNADRGASLEEVESNSIYLINNKYNPYGENRTPFTLGVVYKFQVQVNGNKTDLGYIVSRATCTTEPNAASNMWFGEFKPFNNDNGYIKFEGYPASHSAAVTGEDTDDSHLTELPTLKIRKTGKKFEKITVTAIAFHALGAEKGKDYMSDAPGIFSNRASYGVIQDEQVILGEREELIVVEPGQGTNDPNQSDEEMAIPIEASGAYKMTAVISGNSSKDTKLSDYSAQGKDNPFSNDNKTWYLGLIIGKDEKGKNGSGTFTLTVTAYGSDNDVLETFNYNIAVRRVTKAKIEATAENADQGAVVIQDDNGNKYLNYAYNKANSKITLSATVTGLCGTEYFDIQKDGNGTIKSWEKEGHGKYRTPYSIKWSIYDKKGKELNLSDYFESVPTMIDVPAEGVTKSTITFTLKKALPKGTTIKATSLHAKGQYNDSKTNKSGKEYDNVYAILKIDILDPDDPVDDDIQYLDGLLRGEDFIDFPDQKPSYRPNGGHWFWRKREITNVIVHEDGTQETTYGPWEEYHYMWENSDYKKINAVESRSLLCDKRYQIQMAYMKIDQGNRKVIWPHDSKLVAAGSDSGFAGYSMDWPSTEADTPESEYSVKYNIGRGSMTFAANPEYPITFAHYGDAVKNWESETWNEAPVFYKSFGTLEEPVALQSGGSLKVNVYGYALKSRYYQQISYARLQKLENNTWVSVNPTDICENIQDRSSFVFIKNVKSDAKKGIYRISFRVTKEGSGFWSKWNGSIWEPQYPDMSNTNYLACGSNGASGYIYIEIK